MARQLKNATRTAATLAVLLAGCGAENDPGSETLALEPPCDVIDAGLDEGGSDAGVGTADASVPPDGGASPPFSATVTANGTGCPAGTWSAQVYPDGHLMLYSSAFKIAVDEDTAVDVKNCQLTIALRHPRGLSYSVRTLFMQGEAVLEEGVVARQIAQYYFQGNPIASEQIHGELVGPLDDTYVFDDRLGRPEYPLWSPCGVDRSLNINTTVRLQNSKPRRSGYVNVNSVAVLKLSWRRCE